MNCLGLRLNCMGNQKRKRFFKKMEEFVAPAEFLPLVRTFGWVSVAAGAVTLGYFVGRNLRARYRLNHRTPYDFFSHAGDTSNGAEYGVGI